jgi:hypothetical protein
MLRSILVLALVAVLLQGCFRQHEIDDGGKDADTADGDAIVDGDGAEDADGAPDDAEEDADVVDPRHPIVPCYGDKVYECADGLDNDEDGLVDSDDPDCFGPCDDNELGYFPQRSVDGAGGCTFDCYFDGDTGSGGGDCLWDVRCDPLGPGKEWDGANCSYDPTKFDCTSHFEAQYEQRTTCQSNCEFRTPNGCDCFGCCLFPTATSPDRHLLIGSPVPGTASQYECSYVEAIKEPSPLCPECTPVPSCYKPCGQCELCLGKTTLPEDCTPEEVAGRCGPNTQVCGLPGDEPCSENFYCLSGCCVDFTLPVW